MTFNYILSLIIANLHVYMFWYGRVYQCLNCEIYLLRGHWNKHSFLSEWFNVAIQFKACVLSRCQLTYSHLSWMLNWLSPSWFRNRSGLLHLYTTKNNLWISSPQLKATAIVRRSNMGFKIYNPIQYNRVNSNIKR